MKVPPCRLRTDLSSYIRHSRHWKRTLNWLIAPDSTSASVTWQSGRTEHRVSIHTYAGRDEPLGNQQNLPWTQRSQVHPTSTDTESPQQSAALSAHPVCPCTHVGVWHLPVHEAQEACAGVYERLMLAGGSHKELEIVRDLSRTYPSHVYYQQRQGPGQRSLFNVLRAYSIYDRQARSSLSMKDDK